MMINRNGTEQVLFCAKFTLFNQQSTGIFYIIQDKFEIIIIFFVTSFQLIWIPTVIINSLLF